MSFSGKGRALQAALLWALLRGETKERVARELDRGERARLDRELQKYGEAPRSERLLAEEALRELLAVKQPRWPIAAAAALALIFGLSFTLHLALVPAAPMQIRLQVFQPLFLSIFAPLSLYLLTPLRRRMLFHWRFGLMQLGTALVVFLTLLWSLAFIHEEQMRIGGLAPRLDSIALIFLGMGAVLAPLLEEVVFRELFPSLFGKDPYVIGQLASALAFASAHLLFSARTAESFAWNLVAALALALLRIESEGLVLPYAAHAMANAFSLALDSG